jgi:hypothetical protein
MFKLWHAQSVLLRRWKQSLLFSLSFMHAAYWLSPGKQLICMMKYLLDFGGVFETQRSSYVEK